MNDTKPLHDDPLHPLDTFDHVVVLMLENRSFDNLLGYLYRPEDMLPSFPLGKKFAGLHFDGPHCNPVPSTLKDGHAREQICTTRASSYFQPYPDPGETYGHVNTQLFGITNPAGNEGQPDSKITSAASTE
jgi:phospholipase C